MARQQGNTLINMKKIIRFFFTKKVLELEKTIQELESDKKNLLRNLEYYVMNDCRLNETIAEMRKEIAILKKESEVKKIELKLKID